MVLTFDCKNIFIFFKSNVTSETIIDDCRYVLIKKILPAITEICKNKYQRLTTMVIMANDDFT